MVITELAEGTDARHLGELIGLFGIPAVGLILLVMGLQRRSQATRQAPPQIPMGPPYGYPPPSGPAAGYPNVPAPVPYPPPYPPPYPGPYPAPNRRDSSGTGLIVTGSLLLAFALLGFIGRVGEMSSQSEKSARVGQCITQADFQSSNLNATPRDCAGLDAIFEVAAKGDGSANCPDGKLEGSAYSFLRKGSITLCLMINLQQGQCYTVSGTGEDLSFALADCTSSGLRMRVAKRDDDSSDHSLCPPRTKAISYPNPARLYCLERLDN